MNEALFQKCFKKCSLLLSKNENKRWEFNGGKMETTMAAGHVIM